MLVVTEWDRATRSIQDGLKIFSRIAERSAAIKVIDKSYMDLTTPVGRGLLVLFSALAEDEMERIAKRANEGRELAKSNGIKFGRKPKLSSHQTTKALEHLANGDTAREIGKDMGESNSTISK